MIARVLLLLALASLAALSFHVTRSQRPPVEAAAEDGPASYFAGVEFIGSDDQGRLEYALRAERAEHFPGREEVELTAVAMTLMDDGAADWLLSADQGLAPTDGELVHLDGDVVVAPADGTGPVIRSASMTLHPERELATSLVEVVVEEGRSRMVGMGFEADLGAGRMVFRERVRGRYEHGG